MPATNIVDYGLEEITRRLIQNFPIDWSSEEARNPGGKLHALFQTIGSGLDFENKQLVWIFHACRVATATDTALDTIAKDFFGRHGLKRSDGEPDDLYRTRILQHLFIEKQTVKGIIRNVELFTGFTPTIKEPWNTAMFPVRYWDLDPPNEHSFCWDQSKLFSPELRYQFFIDVKLPGSFPSKGKPVYGLDTPGYWAWDRPECPWFTVKPEFFLKRRQADRLIVESKPVGTIAWRRFTK